MTSATGGDERLVTVHGRGVGDTSNLVVETAQQRGYSVAAIGPGQFRMIRQKRPTWAVVAAILTFPFFGLGLLFLLVKTTDNGSVAVFEGRDGTKVRFVGAVDHEIVDAVSSPVAVGNPQASHLVEGFAMPASKEPADLTPPAPMPDASPEPEPEVLRAAAPETNSGFEPPELIDSSPVARTAPKPAAVDDSVFGETVARPARSPAPSPAPPTDAIVKFPDDRSLPVMGGMAIGRSPRVPAGRAKMRGITYADSSLSKTHLSIEPTDDGVAITDLHSTNGTAVVEGGTTRACIPGEPFDVLVGAEVHAGDVIIRIEATP